jgi:hypothetical protein
MNGKPKSELEFIMLKPILLKPLQVLITLFIQIKLITKKQFKMIMTLLLIPIKKEIPLLPTEKLIMPTMKIG